LGNDIFYGSEVSRRLTYLEFGSIDQKSTAKKEVYDFKLHQKAYDWFMLARYMNDILTIRKMQKLFVESKPSELQKSFCDVHHKNELCLGLGKIAALHCVSNEKNRLSFFELGQTLFGCIDSIILGQLLINDRSIDLKKIDWVGLDISEMFNELAKNIYYQYNVFTSSKKGELPADSDVFYSKGVTLLYAVKDISQLYDFINSSGCSYFDYSFSLKEGQMRAIGTGKTVRYFSFKEFMDSYNVHLPGKKIYVNTETSHIVPNSDQIWLDFFISDNENQATKYLIIWTILIKIRLCHIMKFSSENITRAGQNWKIILS
jgi:hypothetical protein